MPSTFSRYIHMQWLQVVISFILEEFYIKWLAVTYQYGIAYRVDNLFTHVWCTRLLYPPALLYLKAFSHVSLALACRMMFRLVKGQGGVFFVPSNDLRSLWYGWLLFRYLRCPKYNFFPNIADQRVVTLGLHYVHPLYPFVTCPKIRPDIG